VVGVIASLVIWSGASFGEVPYDSVLRVVLPSATALIASCQLVSGTYFVSILSIRRSGHGRSADLQIRAELLARELDGAAAPGAIALTEIPLQRGDFSDNASVGLQLAGRGLNAGLANSRPVHSSDRTARSCPEEEGRACRYSGVWAALIRDGVWMPDPKTRRPDARTVAPRYADAAESGSRWQVSIRRSTAPSYRRDHKLWSNMSLLCCDRGTGAAQSRRPGV
jgi:hypothetical protein